jgi:SOS-response transcriptional repressor LexA
MDMIELIIVGILGIIVGWHSAKTVHLDGFRQLLKALKVTEEDLLRAMIRIQSKEWQLDDVEGTKDHTVVDVKLEQQGTQIFAYRKSDDMFLAQGSDADSLIERLNQNLTPCRVVVAQEDGADLLQKNNTQTG